ncbi:MAG: hypothetical protein COU69_01220 [Candidatus Pacebacteria bacterium CG10_big_fil_rev_8_21_14_0_10_56_10]|nr:MAG: hypothetical protein COU69_01220 [Candidatus Pacebacteria bacterium CG10_big_fil_rev_8_21_14_0_10_56_10]
MSGNRIPLKLACLNIENSRHLSLVTAFLRQLRADVVCLQEVYQASLPQLERALQMRAVFVPMSDVRAADGYHIVDEPLGLMGLAVMTKLPVKQQHHRYYDRAYRRTPDQEWPIFYDQNIPNSLDRAVLWLTVEHDGQDYTIATTHFTWSQWGDPTPKQFRDLDKMFDILADVPPHVLCGDFNAPRGRETWRRLAERYTDNIPPEVKTTLDGRFHKAGQLELVVDGLFSQPEYQLSGVEVIAGLSDHQAVVADVYHRHSAAHRHRHR